MAIDVQGVTYRYGGASSGRQALDGLSFTVQTGCLFALLGPNGGGKTTLFKLLSTLVPMQQGTARVAGLDVRATPHAVRQKLGVTFQSPSLDPKLTVRENLSLQGTLYGLTGKVLRDRIDAALASLGLTDRGQERCEKLSGGLKRRVEIAKSLLHRPSVLLLDEPSTGLDPGARSDLWLLLNQLRSQSEMTVIVTTHLLEEADRCDQVAILDHGRLAASGAPDDLRTQLGETYVSIQSDDPQALLNGIRERLGWEGRVVDRSVRLTGKDSLDVTALMAAFGPQIRQLTLGRPTLEDVFIQATGHAFWTEPAGTLANGGRSGRGEKRTHHGDGSQK